MFVQLNIFKHVNLARHPSIHIKWRFSFRFKFICKRNSFCLSPDGVIWCQLHVPFTTFTLHTSLYRRSIKKKTLCIWQVVIWIYCSKNWKNLYKKKTVELDNFICISAFMDHSDWNTPLFYDSLALFVFLRSIFSPVLSLFLCLRNICLQLTYVLPVCAWFYCFFYDCYLFYYWCHMQLGGFLNVIQFQSAPSFSLQQAFSRSSLQKRICLFKWLTWLKLNVNKKYIS